MHIVLSKQSLGVALLAIVLPVACAGRPAAEREIRYHPIRFFIGPGLAAPLPHEELVYRLAAYVDVLNDIYGATSRQFVFDPAGGVAVTRDAPMSGWCCPGGAPLPQDSFEVWVHAVLADYPEYGSCGGYMSMDTSGAGVAAGLQWARVWDPARLGAGSPELEDFWRQIHNLAHEIGHVFGAGISEYYSLMRVDDNTGVTPPADIDFAGYPDDPYWGERPDLIGDVLLRNVWGDPALGRPCDLESLLAAARFGALSCAAIDAGLRNAASLRASLPDLSRVRVRVRSGGAPVAGARVRVWEVRSAAPYQCRMTADGITNAGGGFEFDWGVPHPFNNYDHLRLIKVQADGYTPAAAWLSVFDAQAAKLLDGDDTLAVHVDLEPSTASAAGTTLSSHPNPFNPSTTIRYRLVSDGRVRVAVYDIRGALVRMLQEGSCPAGEYAVSWDGRAHSGRRVASGAYFCRLETEHVVRVCKLVLVR